MAQPLFELLTRTGDSVNWTERHQQAFEELKLAIMSAPALSLPDLAKPFTLNLKRTRWLWECYQTMGTWNRPVAYLSKLLNNVATRWPGCLQAVAAVALLIWEATKLNLGQDMIIKVSHEVNTLL